MAFENFVWKEKLLSAIFDQINFSIYFTPEFSVKISENLGVNFADFFVFYVKKEKIENILIYIGIFELFLYVEDVDCT